MHSKISSEMYRGVHLSIDKFVDGCLDAVRPVTRLQCFKSLATDIQYTTDYNHTSLTSTVCHMA